MRNKALLSLDQCCNNSYNVQLTSTTIHITHQRNDTLPLTGIRDTINGIWMIKISPRTLWQPHTPAPPPNPLSNNIYELNKKRDIVTYLHQAVFNPVPSPKIAAIVTSFFNKRPGLTTDLAKKHLCKSTTTNNVHLCSIRQNIRSTKPVNKALPITTTST